MQGFPAVIPGRPGPIPLTELSYLVVDGLRRGRGELSFPLFGKELLPNSGPLVRPQRSPAPDRGLSGRKGPLLQAPSKASRKRVFKRPKLPEGFSKASLKAEEGGAAWVPGALVRDL